MASGCNVHILTRYEVDAERREVVIVTSAVLGAKRTAVGGRQGCR